MEKQAYQEFLKEQKMKLDKLIEEIPEEILEQIQELPTKFQKMLKFGAMAAAGVVIGICSPKLQIGVAVGSLGALALRSADHMSQVEEMQEKVHKEQLQKMLKMG